MITADCARCPNGPRHCEGCIVSVLGSEKPQVDRLIDESCGYVVASEVRLAIEVLLEVGLVSAVDIVAGDTAA